ncbi:MAG TPA: type II toxin-antitoxin system RelE/ParE family toxin [Saprospiraceae bacterium]|nr:type II toxin-antitoxin system RelE/ParE family toxin [Saprospiraceae bacterium]
MAGTFQVIITPSAQQDLEDIIDYLTEKESYDRALAVHDEIVEVIESLENMPDRHAPARDTYEFVGNYYRRAPAGKYKVIFHIEEPVNEVFVVRIMHIKRGPDFIRKALL